jgi:hypothetical protein
MSKAAISSFVWGIYVLGISVGLLAAPDIILGLFGLNAHKDVWIYVAAFLALNLGTYFILAARTESRAFFRTSVIPRYLFPVFLGILVALNQTKINILIFGALDVIGATWMVLALRADSLGKETTKATAEKVMAR